jgi:hypothetical protein
LQFALARRSILGFEPSIGRTKILSPSQPLTFACGPDEVIAIFLPSGDQLRAALASLEPGSNCLSRVPSGRTSQSEPRLASMKAISRPFGDQAYV